MYAYSNILLALSATGTVGIAFGAWPLPIPPALVGMTMKYMSIRAYQKTMSVLQVAEDKDRILKNVQYLASNVQGGCTYAGMREAFRDHFGTTWEEEFRKLDFPNFKDADNT